LRRLQSFIKDIGDKNVFLKSAPSKESRVEGIMQKIAALGKRSGDSGSQHDVYYLEPDERGDRHHARIQQGDR